MEANENIDLRVAMKTLERPAVLASRIQEKEPQEQKTYAFPAGMTNEEGAELLLAISKATALEDQAYAKISERVKAKEEATTVRSGEVIDLLEKTYTFLHDHWGEIAWLIEVLDRRKVFDKLKGKSKNLKAIIGAILEEEDDEEKDIKPE